MTGISDNYSLGGNGTAQISAPPPSLPSGARPDTERRTNLSARENSFYWDTRRELLRSRSRAQLVPRGNGSLASGRNGFSIIKSMFLLITETSASVLLRARYIRRQVSSTCCPINFSRYVQGGAQLIQNISVIFPRHLFLLMPHTERFSHLRNFAGISLQTLRCTERAISYRSIGLAFTIASCQSHRKCLVVYKVQGTS